MRVSVKLVAVLVWLTAYAVVGGPPAHGDAPTGTCARAVALVDDGNLRDARALAVVVGPACEGEVLPLTVQAARSAQVLAERAAAAPSDTGKKRLAKLALTIDDANTDAQAVLDSLEPEQDADACTTVEDAIDDGELARAQALLDALADDDSAEDCRTDATTALAEAQEDRWPTRVQHFVVDDGLTTWLVALVAFAVGVGAAGFVRFSSPFRPAVVVTGVVALLTTSRLACAIPRSRSTCVGLMTVGGRGTETSWTTSAVTGAATRRWPRVEAVSKQTMSDQHHRALQRAAMFFGEPDEPPHPSGNFTGWRGAAKHLACCSPVA